VPKARVNLLHVVYCTSLPDACMSSTLSSTCDWLQPSRLYMYHSVIGPVNRHLGLCFTRLQSQSLSMMQTDDMGDSSSRHAFNTP